jgi:putative MFS transporter
MIFLIGGLAYMFDAWDVLLVGFVMPLIKPVWHLSNFQLGLFGTATFVGMAIGALAGGSLADAIGRKRVFIFTVLTYSLFSLASALAPSFDSLLLLRFIAGLGLGATIPVIYPMVAEFMPLRVRGKALNLLDLFWGIGATFNGIVATLLVPYNNWRLLFLVMVLPAFLMIWVIAYLPESPSFLIQKGRLKEADSIIRRLIKRTGAQVEDFVLQKPVATGKISKDSIVSRFVKMMRFNWKITVGIWIVVVVIFLHRFGVNVWLPSVMVKEGYSHQKAFMTAGILSFVGFIGVIASSWLVDILGRKKFIMISSISAAVFIVIFTKVLNIDGYARLAIILYGLSAEPVIATLYTFITESYPTDLRGTGFGCASMIARFTIAFLVSLVFGSLLWPNLGTTNAFVVVGCLVVGGMFVLHLLPETRGKALE